ncbi:hypothetical protein HDE_11644 [Halotydeus destructor]|nr:hypothetical protein HDE_11644 [Halotydeus destructor]
MFELDRYVKAKNVKLNLTNMEEEEIQEQFTIDEIFEFTPKTESILESCGLRNEYSIDLLGKASCSERFKISKLYLQDFICYHFQYYHQRSMLYKHAAHANTQINTMYYLTLNLDALAKVTHFKAILHTDPLPDIDADMAPPISRTISYTDEDSENLFSIVYFYVQTARLPAPYTTDCVNYTELDSSIEDQFNCFDNCFLEQVLSHVDKIPFRVIVQRPYDKKHINSKDLLNQSVTSRLHDAEQLCNYKCRRPDCLNTYLSTYVSVSADDQFTIVVNIPNAPCFEITTFASMSFMVYLVFVCGCINIWFGLSAMTIDPVLVGKNIYQKYFSSSGGKQGNKMYMGNPIWRTESVGRKHHYFDPYHHGGRLYMINQYGNLAPMPSPRLIYPNLRYSSHLGLKEPEVPLEPAYRSPRGTPAFPWQQREAYQRHSPMYRTYMY